MRGRCIDVEKPIAIDGGWSQWSTDYSTCSRTCGGGVQYKQRICNRPKYGAHLEFINWFQYSYLVFSGFFLEDVAKNFLLI